MGDDGLADVLLPDAHGADAVVRNARGIDQTASDGEGADRSGQVAAVARPVDERLVDRHLTEQVVDIMIRLLAPGDDHGLGGTGSRTTHAVDLLAVRIGAADHAQQQLVTRRARHLAGLRQVLQTEEHTLAGAATDIGGRNLDLG
ncbi:hypothetical protein D3C80_1154590 [compost metagenome]